MSVFKKALERWGSAKQLDQTSEECAELIVAIRHYARNRCGLEKIMEEAADAWAMLMQVRELDASAFDYACIQSMDKIAKHLGGGGK